MLLTEMGKPSFILKLIRARARVGRAWPFGIRKHRASRAWAKGGSTLVTKFWPSAFVFTWPLFDVTPSASSNGKTQMSINLSVVTVCLLSPWNIQYTRPWFLLFFLWPPRDAASFHHFCLTLWYVDLYIWRSLKRSQCVKETKSLRKQSSLRYDSVYVSLRKFVKSCPLTKSTFICKMQK